jgi:hypothetical protein
MFKAHRLTENKKHLLKFNTALIESSGILNIAAINKLTFKSWQLNKYIKPLSTLNSAIFESVIDDLKLEMDCFQK